MKKFLVWFPDFPNSAIEFSNLEEAKNFCNSFIKRAYINENHYTDYTIYSNKRDEKKGIIR